MTLLYPGQPTPPPPPTPATPATPTAPPAPATGGAQPGARVVVPGIATPLTRQELATLRSRRSELSTQLQSASNRRNELARELRRSEQNSADRAGLEARLQTLDQRILQLEGDLAETGRLLALAPANVTSREQPARPPARERDWGRDNGSFGMILAFALLVPFAWGAARSLFRRPVARPAAMLVDEESRQRLARLEMAVDAIAIEMERVAEGQRFVARLLSESAAAQQLAANEAAGERTPVHHARDSGQR